MSKVSAAAKKWPTRNDVQRKAVLDAASRLFIEKGFRGTSINDIADAVGVTRTALYYYFPSKESILVALTDDVTGKAGQLARKMSPCDELSADEALRQLILRHATLILSHPLQSRVVERSESSLPEPGRSAAQSARRAEFDQFVRVIQRGIQAGQFRRTDARVAAFSIIGMCNWCAWWFNADGALSADAVASMIAEFGLRALGADKPRRGTRAPSVEDAVGQMHDALTLLEAQIGNRVRR